MSQLPKNHHWVKFNYKDWLVKGSIRDCDAAARGIYMDLYSVAMSEDNVGIIVSDHKKLCKRLGLKFTQFERTLKQLINVKLCVIGKNNEIILTEIASDYSSLVAQQDLKENPTSTQREPNGISTRQGNDSIPPKIETPIIKKNRIDIEKKVSNPPCIPPSGEPAKKGSRLPDDWMPSSNDIVYAQKLNLDPEKVAEDFCDYWHAKAGAGARKADWSLTWKTWCRRENEKIQDKQDRLDAFSRPRKSNLEQIGEKIDKAAKHYDVDSWFENGAPQNYTQKPELKVIGGGRW